MPPSRLSTLWLLTVPLLAVPELAFAAHAQAQPENTPEARPEPPPRIEPQGARPSSDGNVPDPFAEQPSADMSPTADTDLTKSWGYAKGGDSQKPRYVDMEGESVQVTANPIGFYAGVSSTGDAVVPPWAPPSGSPPTLTWPGFERTPNSSRVFFQVSSAVAQQVSVSGLTVTVRFPGTDVNVRNNRRPLVLTYHQTPVARVVVRKEGVDAVATLTLKSAAEPTISSTTAANGYQMIVLEFPDTAAPAAQAAPTTQTPTQ